MRTRCLTAVAVAALLALPLPDIATAARGGDPLARQQWGLGMVKAREAWARSRGRGVVVAIIDTGIDLGHPDLRGKLVPGANFVRTSRPPQDDHGHGTHVAGIVAALTGNGIGVAGVAPDAKLMPVKVLGANGSGTTAAIAAGIRFAADHGAKVLNLSLGTDLAGTALAEAGQAAELRDAIAHAWRKGAVVVVAAGNSSYPVCAEPAAAPHAICVGAVGPDGTRTYYSQGDATGTKTFVCAPGGAGLSVGPNGAGTGSRDPAVDVLSTVGRGTSLDTDRTGYTSIYGTSMATPHVAGIAALLVARRLTNQQVVDRIVETARDAGPAGPDALYGYGVVDAARAVAG